jgi:hypothetical protein
MKYVVLSATSIFLSIGLIFSSISAPYSNYDKDNRYRNHYINKSDRDNSIVDCDDMLAECLDNCEEKYTGWRKIKCRKDCDEAYEQCLMNEE